MRPNIDIPWGLHGQIREYAEKNNIRITEAYEDVLKKGLNL